MAAAVTSKSSALRCDELGAALRFKRASSTDDASSAIQRPRALCFLESAEVFHYEGESKESRRQLHLEAVDLFNRKLAATWSKHLDKIVPSTNIAVWQEALEDVTPLLTGGVSLDEEECCIFSTPLIAAHLQGTHSSGKSSDKEALESLIVYGLEPGETARRPLVGYLLSSFGCALPGNVAVVAESKGLPLIAEALVCPLMKAASKALEFIHGVVDPGGVHAGPARDTVRRFFARRPDLLPAILAAVQRDSDMAVTIIVALLRFDPILRAPLLEHGGFQVLLQVMERNRENVQLSAHVMEAFALLVEDSCTYEMKIMASEAVRLMKQFPKNIKVQISCVGVLHACAPFFDATAWRSLECFEPILDCMALCKAVRFVQKQICSLLRAAVSALDFKIDENHAARFYDSLTRAVVQHGSLIDLVKDVSVVASGCVSTETVELDSAVKLRDQAAEVLVRRRLSEGEDSDE